MNNNLQRLSNILNLARVIYSPIVIFPVISAFILAKNFSLIWALLACVSSVSVLLFGHTINNMYDADGDKKDPQMKNENPIASGYFDNNDAKIAMLVFLTIAIVTAIPLGHVWVFSVLIEILIGFSYSTPPLRLKSKLYGWFLSVPLAVPIVFFTAYIVAGSRFSLEPSILIILIFLSSTMDIAGIGKDICSTDTDLLIGDRNIATVYGIEAARIVTILSSLTALLAYLLLVYLGVASLVSLPFIILIEMQVLRAMSKPREVIMNREHIYKNLAIPLLGNLIILTLGIIIKSIYGF